jgi:nicotinate-nucleotide adenylyltransferase
VTRGARVPLKRGARIGLLGGSFNPAHAGHRHISLAALRLLGLDEIWWLVSPQNPLKDAGDMGSLADRYVSARRAARHPRIRVLTVETELGTRYTVDTVARLQARYAHVSFIWLMGADNLAQFHRWRGWRRLARRVPIAIFPRPGYGGTSLTAPAMAWFRRWRHPAGTARAWQTWELPAIVMLNIRLSSLSASRLRAHDPDWASRLPPRT